MVIQATLPKGEYTIKVYEQYKEDIKKFAINDWAKLKYNENTQEIYNSNYFDQGVLNNNKTLIDLGLRVSVLDDDFNGEIFRLIQGNYYTNFNSFIVHKDKPSEEKNRDLWKKTIEFVEEINKNVIYPFMIQGFYHIPDINEKHYGLKIFSAPNFKIIEDDRLSAKYEGWRFNKVDEIGLPFDFNRFYGNRSIYLGERGLSEIVLGKDGILFAGGESLASSGDTGRIIFVKEN